MSSCQSCSRLSLSNSSKRSARGASAATLVLATANAWNESAQDRTYGLFALYFAVAAVMGVAADNEAFGKLTDYGLGAMVLAVVLSLHFIAAALVPSNKGFKSLVGWITLLGGAFITFLGFAESIGSSIL